MFLDKLFKRGKKKEEERAHEEYERKLAKSRYAELATENVVREMHMSDSESAKRHVRELCEQMKGITQELNDVRSEYGLVTKYLNDVQAIEDIVKEDKKNPLIDCARHVSDLSKARSEYLETEKKLSDTQFEQLEEMADEMPRTIRRMKDNERDLDKLKRDLSYLEGEKLQWDMLRADSLRLQKVLRRMSYYVLIIYATLVVLFLALSYFLGQSPRIPMMAATLLAAVLGVYILVRYQDAGRNIRRSDMNKNRAIETENHVKVRYVNVRNALDYACEKYHARNAQDLDAIYREYLEEVRRNEAFRKTNEDLERYSEELVALLKKQDLYDPKVWMNHANAIVDSRELVELKHNLITRRQGLRNRIEYHMSTMDAMKKEALRQVSRITTDIMQMQQLINKIQAI
ncbi:MAG: hypothetical protein LUI02_02405 [Clostridiales bacterium]|nr:hypothetical protein [Clostridiales bacterium]